MQHTDSKMYANQDYVLWYDESESSQRLRRMYTQFGIMAIASLRKCSPQEILGNLVEPGFATYVQRICELQTINAFDAHLPDHLWVAVHQDIPQLAEYHS
jgi:hypothetical protein